MTKYTREALLQSKEFAKYQPDFLKAILTKESYTLAEARKIVKNFFEPKEVE